MVIKLFQATWLPLLVGFCIWMLLPEEEPRFEYNKEVNYGYEKPFQTETRRWITTLHFDKGHRYLTLEERHFLPRAKHLKDPYFGVYRVAIPPDCELNQRVNTDEKLEFYLDVLTYKPHKDSKFIEHKLDFESIFDTYCI